MKAVIIFNDNSQQEVVGKDLRVHREGPGEFHITDAYKNHRMLAAFANVREVTLIGKPKKAKSKTSPPETLTIKVDTTALRASLGEAIADIEGLIKAGTLVEAPVATDAPSLEAFEAVVKRRDELLRGLTALNLAVDEHDSYRAGYSDGVEDYQIGVANGLRQALSLMGGIPISPLPRAIAARPPERMPIGETGIAYLNQGDQAYMKTAIVEDGRTVVAGLGLGLEAMPAAPAPYDGAAHPEPTGNGERNCEPVEMEAPMPSDCSCPPKRNIETRGHISGCIYSNTAEKE